MVHITFIIKCQGHFQIMHLNNENISFCLEQNQKVPRTFSSFCDRPYARFRRSSLRASKPRHSKQKLYDANSLIF